MSKDRNWDIIKPEYGDSSEKRYNNRRKKLVKSPEGKGSVERVEKNLEDIARFLNNGVTIEVIRKSFNNLRHEREEVYRLAAGRKPEVRLYLMFNDEDCHLVVLNLCDKPNKSEQNSDINDAIQSKKRYLRWAQNQ